MRLAGAFLEWMVLPGQTVALDPTARPQLSFLVRHGDGVGVLVGYDTTALVSVALLVISDDLLLVRATRDEEEFLAAYRIT